MKITLPKPPSINHIYGFTSRGGFARSYITKVGKTWFDEAGYRLKEQVLPGDSITQNLTLSVELYTARRQDVDNILKPLLDLLQKQAVIENDSQIYKLTVEKFRCKIPEEKVIIELTTYPTNV